LLFGAVVALGIAGAAVAVGWPGVGKKVAGLMFTPVASQIINFQVKPANLPVTVTERGLLESSENKDVFCEVEGGTTIIMIVPEGKRVAKGDLVCELDSSALRDQLINQEITTKGAEANYENAKLTRQVAEIAVTEYLEGIYKQDLQTVLGEIALAESEKSRAVDRLDWSKRMKDKGYVSEAQFIADRVSLQQKTFALEQAQTKKDVLQKYTKNKTEKELMSEVEKARSDELAKQATWELEKSKQAKLERQIAKCKLLAPADGLVVYANDPSRFGGSSQPQVEEGAAVRERQKIFSLPDISRMRVNAKVHESMVDRIAKGLHARIRVDAFADQELTGTVESINPLPDPSSFFASDVKVYTTYVTIDKGLPGLRPGMSTQVTILVTELQDVLSVPVQAVLEYKGKDHVAIKHGDRYDWADVELGISNDKLVEVRKGLKAGDLVALNPVSLMSEEEKREAFGSSGKDASKKEWGDAAKKAGGPPGVAGAAPGSPAAAAADGQAPGEGKSKGKGKGKGKGGGFMSKLDPAAREKFKSASPEEKRKILEESGLPADQIEGFMQRINSGGFGGGGGGPRGGFGGPGGGGGGPGGGFGGPGGGGPGGGPNP
jgi:HlyD family secretion protein